MRRIRKGDRVEIRDVWLWPTIDRYAIGKGDAIRRYACSGEIVKVGLHGERGLLRTDDGYYAWVDAAFCDLAPDDISPEARHLAAISGCTPEEMQADLDAARAV